MLPLTRRFRNQYLNSLWDPKDGRPLQPYKSYVEWQDGWTQPRPYDIDTPYEYFRGVTKGNNPYDAGSRSPTVFYGGLLDVARNKARAKFVGEIGDASQLGSTATAEAEATYGTIVVGIAKALKAARHVARLEFGKAGNILGFHPPTISRKKTFYIKIKGRKVKKSVMRRYWRFPDGRTVLKSAGNSWLWYSYGVKPVIEDLYNASEVFTREIPPTRVRGKGYAEGDEGPPYAVKSYKVNAIVSAFVRVDNPNVWLANQLGLLNPVQWFNEGIMFSFVVDWFSNWSSWLQQLTDFFGLEIAKPSTFVKVRSNYDWTYGSFPFNHSYVNTWRELKIPGVVLIFEYERFHWQRGANAISLLVQFLGSKKA